MKSLIRKSYIAAGLVLASVALGGHAMAATTHVKARTTPPAASRLGVDVAAVPPYPNYAAGPNAQRNARFNAAAQPGYQYPAGGYYGGRQSIDVRQLVGAALGMVPPQYAGIVQSAMQQAASHRSSGTSSGGYDPTFDSPSPPTVVDNSQSQAAIDASDAAIQQMDQDLFTMDQNLNNQ
jgi:hypothetical protein